MIYEYKCPVTHWLVATGNVEVLPDGKIWMAYCMGCGRSHPLKGTDLRDPELPLREMMEIASARVRAYLAEHARGVGRQAAERAKSDAEFLEKVRDAVQAAQQLRDGATVQ